MTGERAVPPGGRHVLWIILGCLALTLAFYHPAIHLTFVGDDVWFVRPNPHWLREALMPSATVFHYYPINQILLSALPAVTGWRPEVMHLLNFALYAGIGVGLYLLLRKLGAGVRAGALAALVFISRGINYEVVTWITELSYLLVVVLTLLTLSWWASYLGGRGGRYRAWTVAGFAAAVLTIEHALLLLPLFVVLEWIVPAPTSSGPGPVPAAPPGRERWRSLGRRLVRTSVRYVPFVLVAVVFFAIKLGLHGGLFSSQVAPPTASAEQVPSGEALDATLPGDRVWFGLLNTPWRAYLDLLLSASYLWLPVGTCYGADDTWLTRNAWLMLLPWLAFHVWIVWKGRPLTRFLLAWTYLYLVPLAAAAVPQARYYFLATIPAAGLVGLGLERLHHRLRHRFPRPVLEALTILLMAAMVLGEGVFVRARLKEWTLASDLVQQTTRHMQQDLTGGVREVYLLNFPRGVPGPFWTAYAFGISAEHLQLMLHPPRTDVTVHPVHDRSYVAGRWPTVGRYLSAAEIRGRIGRPEAIAYEFLGRPPWIARLQAADHGAPPADR